MSAFSPGPEPANILILKPSSLGDVVHTLPVLNLLRRRYPKARITWMLSAACAGLLEGHPQLDQVLIFDRRNLGKAWYTLDGIRKLWEFDVGLRSNHFDVVIDLQGLLRSGLMAWRTGARSRIGFANAREGAPVFYTQRVRVGSVEQHAVERYLQVAEAVDCGCAPVEFPFHVTAADEAAVAALVGREPYAVLLPGTNWPTKRWPAANFAALAQRLEKEFGLRSVVAGGPEMKEMAATIGAAVDATGRTPLRQLAALLGGASLVIANDSGPMHIAAALGRPLVAIFGPTNPVRTGPYGRPECVVRLDISCAPCYSRRCSHQSCLQWLEVDAVLAAAVEQMKPRS